MQYTIYYKNPLQHYINIELFLDHIEGEFVTLKLPSWRPGRYEIANFARNIQHFDVLGNNGVSLPFKKTAMAEWQIKTLGSKSLTVKYNYFAHHMDAGSTWLDEEQLYINFINCMLFDPTRLNLKCTVKLEIPPSYKVACGIPIQDKNILVSNSYYHLVESPLIASDKLHHYTYTIENTTFNIWIMGDSQLDTVKLLADFSRFTEKQIEVMKGFPCDDYHFLIEFTLEKSYHGVEHFNSTVVSIGPSTEIHQSPLYEEFLGVSSHELFHTWNAIRIKPKEFIPYDFTCENYFETGYVIEGFTTYYGDLFLAKSKTLDLAWFFAEMTKQINRHLHNFGRFNYSVAQSSYDLWLDGYKKSIPNRKVSIYTKGALIAMIFDLTIRKSSDNFHSLDDLMTLLWEKFGDTKAGYSHNDILYLLNQLAGKDVNSLFNALVFGTDDILPLLTDAVEYVGCEIIEGIPENEYELIFGFKSNKSEQQTSVTQIHPQSTSKDYLSIDDIILKVDGEPINALPLRNLITSRNPINLSVSRAGKIIDIHLPPSPYGFKAYALQRMEAANDIQKKHFQSWLDVPFDIQ